MLAGSLLLPVVDEPKEKVESGADAEDVVGTSDTALPPDGFGDSQAMHLLRDASFCSIQLSHSHLEEPAAVDFTPNMALSGGNADVVVLAVVAVDEKNDGAA